MSRFFLCFADVNGWQQPFCSDIPNEYEVYEVNIPRNNILKQNLTGMNPKHNLFLIGFFNHCFSLSLSLKILSRTIGCTTYFLRTVLNYKTIHGGSNAVYKYKNIMIELIIANHLKRILSIDKFFESLNCNLPKLAISISLVSTISCDFNSQLDKCYISSNTLKIPG